MKVDKELIEKVASLARLKLTEKEVNKFLPQLKEILGMWLAPFYLLWSLWNCCRGNVLTTSCSCVGDCPACWDRCHSAFEQQKSNARAKR